MRKRLFAFLLTLCLLLPTWSDFSVLALDSTTSEDISLPVTEEPVSNDNTFNKIHFYFGAEEHAYIDDMTELQSATASVKSDYAAAIMMAEDTEPSDENVYITVQFASDYLSDKTYLSLKSARDEAKTAEARDMAKSRQNAYSKSYHAAIVEDNLPLLADIPYTNANAIDYSSFVTLTVPAALLDTAVLAEIAENDEILHISLTDGFEVVPTSDPDPKLTNSQKTGWYDVLERVGAKTIVQNGTYTGEGIRIGIYEANHTPDLSHVNLRDKDFTIRAEYLALPGSNYHPDKVASIIALMAPDAKFFATRVLDGENGMLEGIDWFIENSCDIVNMSFGYSTPTQASNHANLMYRYDIDGLYDYQILTSNVVVVKAAGNYDPSSTNEQDGNQYITSPGYAYNVITVGGVNYSTTQNGWVHADNACYMSGSGTAKPNVSAPYTMHIPKWTYVSPEGGTSFSAPLVTACIALWMEKCTEVGQVSLIVPHIIRSLLQSTTIKTVDYTPLSYTSFDNRTGAGIVNLEYLLDSVNLFVQSVGNTTGTNGSTVFERNLNLQGGYDIQISISWPAYAIAAAFQDEGVTNGTKYLMNYSMYLYDNYGNLVASSVCTDSSTELIYYTPYFTGSYKIVVKQVGSRIYNAPITVSYRYPNANS